MRARLWSPADEELKQRLKRLEEMLNVDPDDQGDLRSFCSEERALTCFADFARKLQRAARALEGCPVPWLVTEADRERVRRLHYVYGDVGDEELREIVHRSTLAEAYGRSLKVLDEHPRWWDVLGNILGVTEEFERFVQAHQEQEQGHGAWEPVLDGGDLRLPSKDFLAAVRKLDWLEQAEEVLRGVIVSNRSSLDYVGRGLRWEARRCLWSKCNRLFIAELGKRGHPKEYCRPSHSVRVSEEGV